MRRNPCWATVVFLSIVASTAAMATAQRTFVSSDGNDANPCSLTLPCRGFAAAITQTLSGGEIIVLDSGGYAPVVIDKSVSIIAPSGIYAGISVFSGEGVSISGDNLRVLLRGITINALGGVDGVHVQATNSDVQLERMVISGFSTAGIDMFFGPGISGSRLVVVDSVIRANGSGVLLAHSIDVLLDRVRIEENAVEGIRSSTMPRVHLRDSVIERNGSFGVEVDGMGAGGLGQSMSIERSTIRRNAGGIRVLAHQAFGTARLVLTVTNSVVSENSGIGITAGCYDVSVGVFTVANSTVASNTADGIVVTGTGPACTLNATQNVVVDNGGTSLVNSSAGSFASFGDNRVRSNATDTPAGTITMVPSK